MNDHTNEKTLTIEFANARMEVTYTSASEPPQGASPRDVNEATWMGRILGAIWMIRVCIGGQEVTTLIVALLRAYPEFEDVFFSLLATELERQDHAAATNPSHMKDHPTCQ